MLIERRYNNSDARCVKILRIAIAIFAEMLQNHGGTTVAVTEIGNEIWKNNARAKRFQFV
jgi:hypothetical protein